MDNMKIKIRPNSDTPFCMVEVQLESPEEETLTERELWEKVEDYAWDTHRCNPGNLFDSLNIHAHDGARMSFENGKMIPSNYDWLPEHEKRKT